MYLAKNKLDRKLANATQNVEALHQLASSYFIDRDGTMRKLHEIQISTNAIKVSAHWTCPYECTSYINTAVWNTEALPEESHVVAAYIQKKAQTLNFIHAPDNLILESIEINCFFYETSIHYINDPAYKATLTTSKTMSPNYQKKGRSALYVGYYEPYLGLLFGAGL